MMTVLAFVAALALLIAVHEYGHYRVAVASGVKVLKFSIGFGKTIFKWQPKGSDTEFVIGILPLGGFVKMLDEREAPVPPDQKHLAFNTQPLRKRVAIVAAGPIANLVLAIFLYSIVNWMGVQEAKAILASPTASSVAQRAGLNGGEYVLQASFVGEELHQIQSMEDLRWLVTRGALNDQNVKLAVAASANSPTREIVLDLETLDVKEVDAQLFQKIGITGPWTKPILGEMQEGSAAKRAGLQLGDIVTKVDDVLVVDAQQLRQLIRASIAVIDKQTVAVTRNWTVSRAGQLINIPVTVDVKTEGNSQIGRVGAFVGTLPEMTTVSYGLFDGLQAGVIKTWDVSVLTLKMMGKMLVGQASLKNLSGPLTIADFAGKSASLGLTSYLIFLALISVSLGVLNLLPLPVLDGGHLMYYLWEGVTGKAVSELWTERLQRGGVALLFSMMFIALYNDVTRLFAI
ncbi:MAG: RIP metalloprotease RseP [Burkholderiaceae bacterium]